MNRSRQREVVYEVLCSTKTHPTADWIYEQARLVLPDISKGTVYRNLKELVGCGKAIMVQGVFDKDRFDATVEPHAHLICNECGAVIDFSPKINDFDISTGQIEGAYVTDYSLVYRGLCPQCNAQNKM